MPADFGSTSRSVGVAERDEESVISGEALNALCRRYWLPLCLYIRQKGYSEEDSQDLTQEFFTRLLSKDFPQSVARDNGRLRSFLLVALRNFLANERAKERAQKRGGPTPPVILDFAAAEDRYAMERDPNLDPRTVFDRHWARRMLETALAELGREYAAAGKSTVFQGLKRCLQSGSEEVRYAVLAERLGMSEGAVKVAVHRLRKRLARLLREDVARTLETRDEVDAELRYLVDLLTP